MMNYFEFSTAVIDKVLKELREAEIFIKVGIFQIHDKRLFDVLLEKTAQGIEVELFTLPNDSVDDEVVRFEVAEWTENLIQAGVNVFICKWNIGDPERTTTAVGRWYSYHGKFIVTDKKAIVLSANFTRNSELDAVLMLDSPSQIIEFSKKFDYLVELFVSKSLGNDGKIKEVILNTALPDVEKVFAKPRSVDPVHADHWIWDYPGTMCALDVGEDNHLYIAPFEGRARNILSRLISEAESYIFISTESFTDPVFYNSIIKASSRGVVIKILTGYTSRDFQDRLQNILRELLSNDVKIYSTEQGLHAKLLITEKVLAVSSINLNKINLGFGSSQYWRGNTETIYLCNDNQVIEKSKADFESVLSTCYDISLKLSEKLEDQVKKYLFFALWITNRKRCENSVFKIYSRWANRVQEKHTQNR